MNEDKQQYTSPEIIYEGKITTRAGSPSGSPADEVDPANLFGKGA